ncbi:MAG: PrpF domain-containing protein, partial [Betaproteobacteria bacterium]
APAAPPSSVSRYFTPWRAPTALGGRGAMGGATAGARPGRVAAGGPSEPGTHLIQVLHPQGRIEVEVGLEGHGQEAQVTRASLIRTARKIFEGTVYVNPPSQEYA